MLFVVRAKSIAPEGAPTSSAQIRLRIGRIAAQVSMAFPAQPLWCVAGAGLTSHPAVESSRDALPAPVGAPSGAMLFVVRAKSIAPEGAPT
jgi:hypothetical protein